MTPPRPVTDGSAESRPRPAFCRAATSVGAALHDVRRTAKPMGRAREHRMRHLRARARGQSWSHVSVVSRPRHVRRVSGSSFQVATERSWGGFFRACFDSNRRTGRCIEPAYLDLTGRPTLSKEQYANAETAHCHHRGKRMSPLA